MLLSIVLFAHSQMYSAAMKDNKESVEEQIALARNFPILSESRLLIFGNRPFFTVWNNTTDKGLALKSVFGDVLFKYMWLEKNKLDLYNELNTLFQQNKNNMNKADIDYITAQLDERKKTIDLLLKKPAAQKKKIAIALMQIADKDGTRVLDLLNSINNFKDLQTLVINVINTITAKYQAQEITKEEMQQAFKDAKYFFINSKLVHPMYSNDPKEKKAQMDSLSAILDTYIKQSDAIAENN